ncbi:hypothetical protein GUITHDRAFT_162376 [Guillardia theta CCMP2712]|uniref:Pentacotripeptide-repeat region of PRORP domain-containing protein n=1 Tax=Guillardia theta (strain CCMP2712) TaxID=905079 RepID=L1JJI7_GUITC|nr:hypothetical protein GUITHDRAFT_162376 [Guillardia theta CCMP2712]EKX48477.1 hypothetical protein GUITHDRAFT_162376 [Guillardia theta CCMP2712]|eukprot:XP_005835457.1 hypothetical protein GUITHDRAFT_162376 [Guillardia theta CCMP2712]
MKAATICVFALVLHAASPSRLPQNSLAPSTRSAMMEQEEMKPWDIALQESRKQFFQEAGSQISFLEKRATIEPILAPSASAHAFAEQAIASDVGVEEMEQVLQDMIDDENKTFDYAQLKFIDVFDQCIQKTGSPPGRKAYNCLVNAAELVAWRGDDDCQKKALRVIYTMERLGCWPDVTTVNCFLRVMRASAVQGMCGCSEMDRTLEYFTMTKDHAEAMIGRIPYKEWSPPVGAGRPAIELDTTSLNLVLEIAAHAALMLGAAAQALWHCKEDSAIVEKYVHEFPKHKVKADVGTLEAICLSAFAASKTTGLILWDVERLLAMVDSWQFRMENSVYTTSTIGKASSQNFLTSADPDVFSAWMLVAMREAWEKGDDPGGEGGSDEDLDRVFMIQQQAKSRNLEETEEMKSLLREAKILWSKREQNRNARRVNEEMKQKFGKERGGVVKMLMGGKTDMQDVPDLWKTF